MKHNGLANLFLGFIYGGAFTYVHAFVDEMPFRFFLTIVILSAEFLLTCILYCMDED